jgi:decaprenyl-diphosphate synthase subunit 1
MSTNWMLFLFSQVLNDLVQGEFMQLGAKETENERFSHYFTKTYRKTASLIANSLKAVSWERLMGFKCHLTLSSCFPFSLQAATISGADAPLVETAFQYGKNLGLAFQFVDDLLDFVSSSETMGKPAAADLKLGLATAPVLFACEKVSKWWCSLFAIKVSSLIQRHSSVNLQLP